MAADCMPVLLADRGGGVVAAVHAGWRGLCAGVIEAALEEMRVAPHEVLAWLGPAIGPKAYEVGDEVREAFLLNDATAATAFVQSRPGHWLLDLYAVARMRLAARGVASVYGGGYCTFSEKERFFSFRRDRATERMAAVIWIA
jgi:YfiH family protein